MRAYGLFVLLVASTLAAPQGEPTDNEVEAGEKQPKARQLGEQFVYQAPQFGAKLAQFSQAIPAQYSQVSQYSQGIQGIPAGAQVVYLQGYQQPQYYNPGQQIAYIAGAPAQAQQTVGVVSGAPQTYYSGSYSAQFPQANLVAVKKTVKPVKVAQPQVYKTTVTSYKPAPAPAPASAVFYKPQPAPAAAAFTYKAPAPAAAAFEYKAPAPAAAAFEYKAPAPAAAAFAYKAPAPAPAPIKISGPAPQAVQYSANAQPVHVIVKQFEDNNFDGSFTSSYETDHGIVVESSGYLKNAGTENEVQVIQGSYTYYSPEGVPITTTYIADENGFQVQGDHLPVPPPLPEAIAKSIEYQRSLPPSPEESAAAAARQ